MTIHDLKNTHIQIHAGTGCENSEAQAGHYYDPESVAVDPWLLASYLTTDSSGTGAFVGCVITGTGAAEYDAKPFIVHGTDGSRLSCGILSEPDSSTAAPTDTPSGATTKVYASFWKLIMNVGAVMAAGSFVMA